MQMFIRITVACLLPSLAAASIGDRLVLEQKYLETYITLPLTAEDAIAEGWKVEDICRPRVGRRAEGGPSSGSLHLWFDKAGALMGAGGQANHGVATPPWRRIGSLLSGHYEIDYLFRDPEAACGDGAAAVPGSIGDRLLLVSEDIAAPIPLPLTQKEANASGFTDAGPCWTDMGYHMIYPKAGASLPFFSPVMPMYTGDGLRLTGVNTPVLWPQDVPPAEHFAMGHGGPVYGLHLYFIETKGVCGDAPTLPPFPKKASTLV